MNGPPELQTVVVVVVVVLAVVVRAVYEKILKIQNWSIPESSRIIKDRSIAQDPESCIT